MNFCEQPGLQGPPGFMSVIWLCARGWVGLQRTYDLGVSAKDGAI